MYNPHPVAVAVVVGNAIGHRPMVQRAAALHKNIRLKSGGVVNNVELTSLRTPRFDEDDVARRAVLRLDGKRLFMP